MRTLKLIFIAVILVAVVLLAVANRGIVTLNLLPGGLSSVYEYSLRLPLFVVILASIGVGLILGYLMEWLREHKHRSRASEKAREAERLRQERDRLRRRTGNADDDVLALLN